ncbi:DUF2827 family protein [Paraburkholderia sp. Cpub6]|uniref:DUF2827 family protein n=1 Tax=Paraburkholderia sp. Cpub6 TaxID=2723094 RepID=UPI0017F59F0E|nr:hypothetical protein [Paraburkholderia sp. Cpub6]
MFLAQNTDIVISHQLENPLNYFYLEVRWQGYPLVHNAHLCADLGYYYRDNDVEEGARRAIEATDCHDAHTSWYREKQRTEIARYLPDNRQPVATYAALLDDLIARAPRQSSRAAQGRGVVARTELPAYPGASGPRCRRDSRQNRKTRSALLPRIASHCSFGRRAVLANAPRMSYT